MYQPSANNSLHKNGNYYQLIYKPTNLALTIPTIEGKSLVDINYTGKIPYGEWLNMNNVNQLWMIEEMQPNRYEIVHANSTLVLEWMSNIFQLMFGKWKITQFFYIENAMTTNPWEYYIRESVGSKKLVYFDENKLVCREHVQPESCIWILKLAEEHPTIVSSVMLENANSNMMLDVPEASSKLGMKIVQWTSNRRFNQRWQLIQYTNNTYKIHNLKSGMNLDVSKGKEEEFTNVVQWEPHSGLNQFWQLEYQGKGLYIIRSMIRKELMLGFKNGMPKEGEELVTVVKEDSALWRIIGEWPRPSPIYV